MHSSVALTFKARNFKTLRLYQLVSKGRKLKLAKGEVVQTTEDADKLLLIKSGYIKKYLILSDGSIRIQIIYGPGDIFPLTIAFKMLFDQDLYRGPEVYYYETMCETVVRTIDRQTLLKSVKNNSLLYSDLLSEAGKRLESNIQQLENVGLPNAHKRVAHQLVYYARTYGEKRRGGIRIKIPLTQQDIADVLSATRETVSLSMSTLRKKGLIKYGRHIIVPDVKKLEETAYQ